MEHTRVGVILPNPGAVVIGKIKGAHGRELTKYHPKAEFSVLSCPVVLQTRAAPPCYDLMAPTAPQYRLAPGMPAALQYP
jgi:hypothetical protein